MSKAKITLIGMSKWMADHDDDLFANLVTPTGIDRSKVINTILMNGGEFEVLYGDPDFIKFLIGVWSDKWQRTMEKWISALSIDYNPLENYDRMEDWEDNSHRVNSEIAKKDSLLENEKTLANIHSEKSNKSETALANDHDVSSGSGNTENKVSAYDASTYVAHDKAESTTSGANTAGSITNASGIADINSIDNQIAGDKQTGKENEGKTNMDMENAVRKGRAHGNIGVTTSQQMLEAELDISKFNIYDEISNLFLTEFVVYTY